MFEVIFDGLASKLHLNFPLTHPKTFFSINFLNSISSFDASSIEFSLIKDRENSLTKQNQKSSSDTSVGKASFSSKIFPSN
jgi:hypothetical protein